jgi:chromosome partitioning protein
VIVTAVVNQKGGVGKTTTTINVGRALGRCGRRTLLIDLDEQAALTFHFLGEAGDELASLYDIAGQRAHTNLSAAITASGASMVDVLPANADLALLNNDLVIAGVGRESRLSQLLSDVADRYDVALIDCPPSLNLLTVNALVAADQVLIVTEPELYSGRGVAKLLDTIDSVRVHLNPQLSVAGVLINKYDTAQEIHQRRAAEIRHQLSCSTPPILVLPTVIPRWTTVMRTTDGTGDVADLLHPAARKVARLYDEVARRLGLRPFTPRAVGE